MQVYRTAIKPILLYGTEVIYETLSPIVLKRLLAVEYVAIRVAYKLDRNATIAECLATHQGESIISRIDRRRTNFVIKNADNPTIRHAESLKTNKGRHLRIRKNYVDKHSVRDWKRPLYTHKNTIFFSEIDTTNYRILHEDDPDLDIIRTDRRHDETILDHIDRTQHSQIDQPPSQPPVTLSLIPKFTLRRADNGAQIKPYNPKAANLRLRRARRNASSSESDNSDSKEPQTYRRYGSNIYPGFPPVPYVFQTNPRLRQIQNTQTRIADEINETLEWKRNEIPGKPAPSRRLCTNPTALLTT